MKMKILAAVEMQIERRHSKYLINFYKSMSYMKKQEKGQVQQSINAQKKMVQDHMQ